MASYTALMNIQVDSQQAQLGINNLNKNLTYLSRSSRLTNKSLLQMQQTFLRIENTINQATGNTAAFNGKMQQAMNVIKKLRGEVSSLRSQINSLNTATSGAGTSATKATTAFQRFTKTLQQNQYFTSLAVSALAGFVNQRLIGGIIRITDEYTLMENKIKTVTPTVDGVATSMAAVKAIAQDTRQPLSIIANMFSRIGRNSKELQGDLTGLIDVTSTVSKAFQIGGATIEESRNAMVQFSQALASGRLQGDELRSILELAPELAKAISKSIGITTGSLRKLASEGLITTEVLIKSLLEAGKEVRETFDKFVPTVEQSAETVVTSFTAMIGGNEKFKQANEVLGNQLRTFASALDEQGSIANTLGEAYLTLARNVDVLASAFVGIGAAIAGAGLVGFFMLLASAPVATGLAALTALISGMAFYTSATEGAKEAQNELVKSTDDLLKKLKESGDTLGEKELAGMQTDIITKQSQFRTLISETRDEIKQLNEDIKETEGYNAIERLLAKTNPDGETLLGAKPLYMDQDVLKEQKRVAEEELKLLEDQAKGLEEAYDNITDAIQGGAMQAMLARTQALEAQKRLLQKQTSAEQMDYLGSFGAGMSDKNLGNIKFANQAAQELRKSISDITMKLTDRAFMGPLSVDTLFGNTDPATAVSNLSYLVQKFKEETAGDPKETGGKVVSFFDRLMGIEKSGDPAAIKALNEIKDQLTREPFKAELLRENMITVWESALKKYNVYAAEVQAQEDRFIALKKKDLQFEAKEQQAIFNAEKHHLDYLLDESATIHDANIRAIRKQEHLREMQILIELESKEISAERVEELRSELQTLYSINTQLAEQAVRARAVNEILQNREKIRVGKSTQEATAEVGGFESFGGTGSYDLIGSALRDINIQYKVQLSTIEEIYGKSSRESIELRTQEGILKNINIQKKISEVSDSVRLDIAREMASNEVLGRETQLQEQGLNASEIKIKLLEEESQLALDSLQYLGKEGEELRRNVGLLYDERIETEKLQKIREDLAATYAERAVGGAVIEGAQALFDGEFYKNIYNSLVTGGNYLLDGIKQIKWSDLGTHIGDGFKSIDWSSLGALFTSGMGALTGSGLFQGIASAGGASGQRAMNIAQAGAAGGPVAALGAAILSNEKVQAALSKLFDAVFEFIDPFIDLLGPVVDIFTAMVKNNPIMTAVNALKPLLTNLGNMLSALASAIESLDLSQQGGTLGYIFGGGLASDLEENIGGTLEGFGQGISGFGGIAAGIVEEFSRSIEEVMGSRYFQVSAQRVKSGAKDFMDVYREAYEATANELVYYTERVTTEYKFMGITVYKEYQDYVRSRAMTEAERIAKARDAVLNVLNQVLDGIEDETEALLDEAEKLNNQSMKTDLEQAIDTAKSFRSLLASLEEARPSMGTKEYEDAKVKLEAFVDAQQEYFAAFVGSEILQATKDLEESVLSFRRMATDPLDQAAKGLGVFEKQVQDFQNAINEVADPEKAKQLKNNLNSFIKTFKEVSTATSSQQIYDLSFRGLNLTPEQELVIKYEKEIRDVRAQENLTIQDKIRVIKALNEARNREVAAMEREQELLNLRGAQSALAEILSTFEKTIEGINDLIQSLYDQVQDLLFGEFNLDPYLKKFELASDTYGTLLEAAFDPDATEDDIKKLQEFVNTYLGTARDLYKSSSTFQQIFSNVLSDLSVLGVQAGFNMPSAAVGDATSGIQEFISATEDLSDELSSALNDLIYDLNDLGMTFAQQKINLIQDGMNIPLKITNDMIVVDLGSVNQTLTLTDDNFTLDLTKLDLAASFEAITFTPNFGEVTDESGWQNYHKTATFTASIIGWDPFAGRAAYSATATFSSETDTDPVKYGWTDYAQTASFSAILLNWGEYSAEATLVPNITLGDYTSEVIVYATLQRSFTKLGETAEDVEGFHTGYARLDLNLQGTMTTSSGSPKQYYGYASLTPSLSGMYTNSYYNHTGYASFTPQVNFNYSSVTSAFNALSSTINTSIQNLNQSIAQSLNYIRLGFDYEAGPYTFGAGTGYAITTAYTSNTDVTEQTRFGMASAADQVAEFKRVFGNPIGNYAITFNHEGGMGVISFYENLSHAQSAYTAKQSPYLSHTNVKKYGFQKGGLVPGPMDTIPAMLAPGEYIMSQGAVDQLGIGTLNSLNAGDLSALRQTGDPEVRSLLRELIIAVKTSDTEVNVYTDMKGEAKAAIGEFRTELRERSRRQGEKYVNVRYV